MNEKISYLNVFFQNQTNTLPPFFRAGIADQMPEPVFVVDPGPRMLGYSTQKFFEVTGVQAEMFVANGERVGDLVPIDDLLALEHSLLRRSQFAMGRRQKHH